MERWTRIRRRAAVIALVIGLALSLGTAGVAGATSAPSAPLSQETTAASDPADASVEFAGCSAAEVSGDVDRATAHTSFYGQDGIGDNRISTDSVDGSTTIEAGDDGINGESLDSVTLYRDGEVVAEQENPNKESCWEEIKPEEPTISFVGQERTGGGYAATYEYTNPNDVALYVNNGFDKEVSGETPAEFRSGTHQFTVNWSPNVGERLTWSAHLGTFGYDTVEASSAAAETTTAAATDETTGAASAGSGAVQPTETMTEDETTTIDGGSNESTSGDGSTADASVEFTGCSAARITGEADYAMAHTSFYGQDGIGDNTVRVEPVSGTTTVEAGDDGINGESLDSVTLYRDGEVVAEKENPNKESCWERIKPEKPTVSFVGAERAGDGSYEMTYEYTNPNDRAMFVNSEFDADVSGGTPEEFRSGTHRFTVEWSPDDAERLTWSAHLGTFGYDTVRASGSVPAESTDDGPSGDGSDGDDNGDARADGGSPSDDGGNDAGSDDSGSSGDGSAGTGSSAGGSNAGAGNDDTTTTAEAAQGSSGTDGSNADGGDTATPTATDTTAANATDSAMNGGTDGVETEITGGVESSGQPGMGAAAALIALVASTLGALRRR